MKFYTIGQFSKLVGKSIQTLRLWDSENKLKPHHISDGGHRYYSEEQIYQVTKRPLETKEKKIIGYCRVSSDKQKDDLARQVENVKLYMIAKGYTFDTITDIGNGINCNRKGMTRLVSMITDYAVEKIVILHKDRLAIFEFDLIESFCNKYGTEIEIIDKTEETEEQEPIEDLVQIVTVFSQKLHGKRASMAKDFIKELLKNDST